VLIFGKDYNPPHPYTRRMWAGGSFHWPKPRGEVPGTEGILVGSSIVEETSVAKIEEKKGMVFVHQAKEYKAMHGGPALAREVRIHVFRPTLDAGSGGAASPKPSSKFDSRREGYRD
jgi:3-methylfumaryl-CoA hydratase